MIDLREQYDELFIKKTLLLQDRIEKSRKLKAIRHQIKICTKAHFLLTEIGKKIQKQFKKKVEKLITNAIQAVYDYPFIFRLKFENKRNNIEIKPIIKKGNKELVPKDDMGGGILDVIALGLQIILWHLQNPKSRPILFLDEPFRFLGDLTGKAGYILKYLSKSFGLQIVMTSHDTRLTEFYDKIYRVDYDGIESTVNRQLKERK
jgi:DNA repair exonuclease SbcCD ATPase subunit